ncbi:MAG: Rid family detoxifying hydrolase [Candidatus Marinimicrobia bacterium]|jgi:2-iminobutanoate/2-iminopropanoate deaminase|nr:Rid family detoxifying hydrolase [Candidatus Neomarinimicrobiota bacterium]MDD4961344.1 Rid family detoxifying hydrolase [Candidatus Neomarinimicrobiota bacterium]MDD5709146.1 Rid family detoxifying hydrolase [Candidatus Neomarinimicrobiota bacterium]MDX9778230.1 Rid family detoxifying hydrolase [bacterium]
MKTIVSSPNAPAPIGAYSQGNAWNGLIFTSGQLPVDPSGALIRDDIVKATRAALDNVIAVVEAGGGSKDSILKITVFLRDLENFADVNAVFAGIFPKNAPARSAFQVARLPKDADIEIEAVAAKA